MARRPAISQPQDEAARVLDGGFWLVVAMAAVCGVLVLAMVARGVLVPGAASPGTAQPSAAPIDVASFLYPTPREAPPIELTDPDVRPFSLASLRGEPAFVFFGYTHCPDVCPATIGRVGLAMDAFGSGVRAVFVSVDPGPVILNLSAGGSRLDYPDLHPTVQLEGPSGEAVGDAVLATPVQPPGVDAVSYVANLAIPTPGAWRIGVVATRPGTTLAGSVGLTALDPGTTAPLGAPAPRVRTPTLDDVGGNARAVTTDPAPDLRLSQRSTTDALADGQPFVLVVDSTKFRVSPACGRTIIMARYLVDRWPTVGFIHLEPYRYSVVTDTPVLDGSLDNPSLTDASAAWGIGGDPWGARSMPWVFVVDGHGIVRAKYQGVMGSADVDVIVALIEQGG